MGQSLRNGVLPQPCLEGQGGMVAPLVSRSSFPSSIWAEQVKPKRSHLRAVVLCAAVLLLSMDGSRSIGMVEPTSQEAYFRFDYPPYLDTFVIQLRDATLIDEARAMLAGELPSLHIMGQVVKQPADYNPAWSYHLDTGTIRFFHSAVEVCDETIASVEQHLEEVCGSFLPGCTWCPWGSRLIEEVPPPFEPTTWLYFPLITR